MNQTVISENIKRYRTAKGYTQEQVAEKLSVNPQTVSRWECGSTMPDVLMLPRIAELYGIIIDDLFKKQTVAYANYAERLSSVYEKSGDPEDFLKCRQEYRKLMRNGELSINDKWNYATIHHFMLLSCKKEALEWYDRVLASDDKSCFAYRRAASMKVSLLFEIGQGESFIREQSEKTLSSSEVSHVREWILLIEAYQHAKRYDTAYEVYRRAVKIYPDNWELYLLGGDCCGEMERYDEAFECFRKASEIGTEWCDDKYMMAYYYKKLGEYKKAYEIYLEIAEIYRRSGFDVEADMAKESARELKSKLDE